MTELGTLAVAAAAPVAASVLPFAHPLLGKDVSVDFDCADIPADVRLEFLKTKVRDYISNRLNSLDQRHKKDEKVAAWDNYEAAQAADPLQSVVAKPDFERPAAPDFKEALDRAFADLREGKTRKHAGEGRKPRERKDPLIKAITNIVVDEVYAKKNAADPKFTFVMAKAEVGADGLAYLNGRIDTAVADASEAEQPALRAALEKMRETKYVTPAKLMLGLTESKAIKELPSIL